MSVNRELRLPRKENRETMDKGQQGIANGRRKAIYVYSFISIIFVSTRQLLVVRLNLRAVVSNISVPYTRESLYKCIIRPYCLSLHGEVRN